MLADGVGGKGSDSADTVRSLAIFDHLVWMGPPRKVRPNPTKRLEVGNDDLNPIDFTNCARWSPNASKLGAHPEHGSRFKGESWLIH